MYIPQTETSYYLHRISSFKRKLKGNEILWMIDLCVHLHMGAYVSILVSDVLRRQSATQHTLHQDWFRKCIQESTCKKKGLPFPLCCG